MGDIPLVHGLHLGLTVLGHVMFALIAGAVIMSVWPAPMADATSLRRRERRLLASALAIYAVAALGNLWLGAAAMSGQPLADAGPAVALTLTQSHFGAAWLVGAAAWLATAIAIALSWPSRAGARRALTFAALAVIALSHAAVSHAADAGDGRWPEWVQSAHLVLTAIWSGTLLVAVLAVLPAARATSGHAIDGARWRAWCGRLSRVATVSLLLIVASGIPLANRTVGGLAALRQTSYGHLLDGKLALVIVAAALGGVNRWHVLPRIEARPTTALLDFTRIATIEALVLVGVYVMAVMLGHAMPGLA